ncbi:MAG: aminoacyl-tRNA hydrolase [Candidatus Babeliales bacterium]|jgi:PTH1 family peptidyl-tRNA hydrolase
MNSDFDLHSIKAIIGLGNPGSSYARNRHSIGFRVVDALANTFHASWQSGDLMEHATIAIMDTAGRSHTMYLIKPQTFMNNSGRVLPWLTKKGIKPDQILVLHDELEKPFGKLILKFGGSHKGHNGLKSIIGVIGAEFWRLGLGIGRPVDKNAVSEYVLSNFSPDEEARVPELIDQAVALIVK